MQEAGKETNYDDMVGNLTRYGEGMKDSTNVLILNHSLEHKGT